MPIYDVHLISRRKKRWVYFLADTMLVPLALVCALVLQDRAVATSPSQQVPFLMMTVLGAGIIWAMGLNRIRLAGLEAHALSKIGAVAAMLAVLMLIQGHVLEQAQPIPVALIFGLLFCAMSIAVRIIGLHALRAIGVGRLRPVAIYGAGSAGIQLAAALWQSQQLRPVVFVDDNPNLQGLLISGLRVYAPRQLSKLIQHYGISQVLVAVPSLSKTDCAALLHKMRRYPVEVRALPPLSELISAESLLDSLQPIAAEAVMGRQRVSLETPEIAKTYAGRVIMVTGAGGSIGAELCRQLSQCRPARLVLFDQGERNLYQIDQELRSAFPDMPRSAQLGSVCDPRRVRQVICDFGVDVILHTAAYKHVPIVEQNELEGARNNVLGTQTLAEVAASEGIERFILVSSDKAVRPANVMGATKRMAELTVQDIQTRHVQTKFAMVRFGNVLGSSGSMLPLFQKQIMQGGPVTVTHAQITRYFMTIPEAACLVLTAGAYARGGDVFVLDMGKPQRIVDVARRMIELSGRTVRDPVTGDGEVAIEITGLRPGEKMFEELLIDKENLLPTPHPKILRAQESRLSQIEVAAMLRDLRRAVDQSDVEGVRAILRRRVEGYQEADRRNATM